MMAFPLQVAAQVDVAFLIDGSSSIDNVDFELERDGLSIALANPLLVPRDGSVSLSVVQFAGSSTRIEVPYTTVTSDADVNQILAQLSQMTQIRGATNPGDGVNAAVAIVNAAGNAQARQSICLATDGLPNSGASIDGALAAAVSSPIAFEGFGVIAVEDPPNFFAQDFQDFYGPRVFGGSTVTTVRNAAEFANTVGGACFPTSLRVVGLEVNQAIQDWQNSVRLIADKATYVRAFVETDEQRPVNAVVRLRGFRQGVELAGSPLVPINAGGSIIAPIDATVDRGVLGNSLNFRLPASWLQGTLTLEVEGIGSVLDCQEAAGGTSDCRVEASFATAEEPEVRYVALSWSQNGQTFAVSDADIDELIARQLAISPVASVDAEKEFLAWPGNSPPDVAVVNEQLEAMRFWDLCWPIFGCQRLYYGAIDGPSGGGGLANSLPGTVSSGYLPVPSASSYGRNRHVHEIAHTLGLSHAPFCGAQVGANVTPLNYDSAFLGNQLVATLGPLSSGEDQVIYGLDTHTSQVIDPTQTFELMSYCGVLANQFRWISKITYDALWDTTNTTFSNAQGTSPKQGATVDYLTVRGRIDPETDAVELSPFATLTSDTQPPMPSPGEYALRAFDSSGQMLEEVAFAPIMIGADAIAGSGDEPAEIGIFLVPIEARDVDRIEITKAATTLATRTASANAPTVTVTAPTAGQVLAADLFTIEWQAADSDDDDLTYLVQYSADAGATWKTLVLDWPSMSYSLPKRFLAGSDQAMVRVLATDGFRSTLDESDIFSVNNNPPTVEIVSPLSGQRFTGVQLVAFAADAEDREDRILDSTAITWSSDLDGALGTGSSFELLASDLSAGRHQIQVTVRDSAGATATDTAELIIGRIATPPCVESATSLCLNQERFRVELEWLDSNGVSQSAQVAMERSADSGLFWFSDPDNWELLVKVLDGCDYNDRFWFFAASATNVEYRLTVTDTVTGGRRTYFNPAGNVAAAFTDADAFASCNAQGANPSTTFIRLDSPRFTGVDMETSYQPGPASFEKMDCIASDTEMCLNANRFLVEVEWEDFTGRQGRGTVVPFGTVDSGLFWFFVDRNWEVLVKVLDACDMNDHFWVFAAATTNVQYRLRVTDTQTGAVKEYFNPLGLSANPVTDTEAFRTCP